MANGQIKETQSLWANYYIHLDTLVHHSIIILSDNLRISKQFAGKLESTSQSKKRQMVKVKALEANILSIMYNLIL